jgi:hypothetical protein
MKKENRRILKLLSEKKETLRANKGPSSQNPGKIRRASRPAKKEHRSFAP